jgi:RNA polymerase sigma factor (sigma-70 family)
VAGFFYFSFWHGQALHLEPRQSQSSEFFSVAGFFYFQGENMDFLMAVEWVRNNEAVIKGNIVKYRNFSPYEECDYMQEAFEAAMIATMRAKAKKISFEAAFWTIFRRQVGIFTPNPDDKSNGSNSVPSHLCSVDIDTVSLRQKPKRRRRNPNIEAIFREVSHFLTEKEQQILYLALGISDEGRLSNYEIAERLGCSAANVRDILGRANKRLKGLVTKGTIDPNRLR